MECMRNVVSIRKTRCNNKMQVLTISQCYLYICKYYGGYQCDRLD